ncbi:hypothetical protein K474DRAFT_1641748 [Panus rudis PR-1116 ss-1]|nr:hypothetical protein K474DRAFT_1641748 [Panus rudis PR-1116 ss-1]
MSLSLSELYGRFQHNPALLDSISTTDLFKFITHAAQLRNDILLAQPATHPLHTPPAHLPTTIAQYLSEACNIPIDFVPQCWVALRDIVWERSCIEALREDPAIAFSQYGSKLGLERDTFYLPNTICTTPGCSHQSPLKNAKQKAVLYYTLDRGVLPAWDVQLYCATCKTSYHHNYRVCNGRRIYYGDIPSALQVAEHRYVECRIANMWLTSMFVSWTSATNLARLYELSFIPPTAKSSPLPFSPTLKTEDVWDAVVLLSLLEDCQRREQFLDLPHDGAQEVRFSAAMKARNDRIRLHGLPEVEHFCDKCTRFFPNEDGSLKKTSCIVIDGITIGHPCCSVHNCHIPLASTRHRFCPTHEDRRNTCCVDRCEHPAVQPGLVCDDPLHQEIQQRRNEREDAGPVACPNKPLEGNRRITARFGRRRTHNELIIVAPCGTIISRATCYGAEAVSSVVELVKRTYYAGPNKINQIVFDNNCNMALLVYGGKDTFFNTIGLSVDVFHFKSKHSVTDVFCQEHCNPAAYPELLDDNGGWFFNTSIAEQTNVWLAGFNAICREMVVEKYNFFLDEMIMRRNCITLENLTKGGRHPGYWKPSHFV